MKRIIFCILTLSLSLCMTANDDPHLKRLIECINDSDFVCATAELPLVENWDDLGDTIFEDIHRALAYCDYVDSLYPQLHNRDECLQIVSFDLDARATACKSVRNYAEAIYYYQWSAQLSKRVFGENHEDYAACLFHIWMTYYIWGQYENAIPYLREQVRIRENLYGKHHIKYLTSVVNLGAVYTEVGNYASAEECFAQALSHLEDKESESYITILNHLGSVCQSQGKYANAESYYTNAKELCKKLFGEQSELYAQIINNIASLYGDTGNAVRANQYYLLASQIFLSLYGENSALYAISLNNLASTYRRLGDLKLAKQYYLQAAQIRKNIDGETHPRYILLLNNLGIVCEDLGERDEAENYFIEALRLRKQTIGENHIDYAVSLRNLGAFYMNAREFEKAEPYTLQALQIVASVLGKQHFDYGAVSQHAAVIYEELNDYTQAESYYLQSAAIFKDLYIKSVGFLPEEERSFYWEKFKAYYETGYTPFVCRYYPKNHSITTFAYNNELFTKGLLLTSTSAVANSILESGDSVLIAQWNDLIVKKQKIMALEESEPKSEDLERLRNDAEVLEKEITKASATYRENQRIWTITWDSVRAALKPHQVAIEYIRAQLGDSAMYCALLLKRNSKYPVLIPLFEEKELMPLVQKTTPASIGKAYAFDENGKELNRLIWSKILPYIKSRETVFIAPTGILHEVAMEAIPYDQTHTVADKYHLVRLSSTREIATHKTSVPYEKASLYGGVYYDVEAEELLAQSATYQIASRGISFDSIDRGTVSYLKGTKEEVENIRQMLHDNHLSVQLFTATNANEESFKALSGKHQNILHIATHGFYWSDSTAQKKDYFSQRAQRMDDNQPTLPALDPLNRCGLLFAGANTALSGHSADLPEGVQDGILTAKEISLLDLRDADLVVLSACETGKGEITGEGVFGLQRAFKQAGAQTIIMSLWPVNDAATQMLMTEFYRNWITNHQPKREAFRNAQNTVRTQFEEPVFWAGFIMLD